MCTLRSFYRDWLKPEMMVIVGLLLYATQCACRLHDNRDGIYIYYYHLSLYSWGGWNNSEFPSFFIALSKRIHYGKFVAEAKFRESPAVYEDAIRAKDRSRLME